MTLEDLVPPLDLCKRIPAGEFADSALVWVEREDHAWVADSMTRVDFFDGLDYFSAPTLPEIMAELPPETECSMSDMGVWYIINPKIESIGEKANNPATAALRLWFKLKGVEG